MAHTSGLSSGLVVQPAVEMPTCHIPPWGAWVPRPDPARTLAPDSRFLLMQTLVLAVVGIGGVGALSKQKKLIEKGIKIEVY